MWFESKRGVEIYRRELSSSSSKWCRSTNCHNVIFASKGTLTIFPVKTRLCLDFYRYYLWFFSTGMNVNLLFLSVWNVLVFCKVSTTSRGLKGGKVKIVKKHLFWEMRCNYFLMTAGFIVSIRRLRFINLSSLRSYYSLLLLVLFRFVLLLLLLFWFVK